MITEIYRPVRDWMSSTYQNDEISRTLMAVLKFVVDSRIRRYPVGILGIESKKAERRLELVVMKRRFPNVFLWEQDAPIAVAFDEKIRTALGLDQLLPDTPANRRYQHLGPPCTIGDPSRVVLGTLNFEDPTLNGASPEVIMEMISSERQPNLGLVTKP